MLWPVQLETDLEQHIKKNRYFIKKKHLLYFIAESGRSYLDDLIARAFFFSHK